MIVEKRTSTPALYKGWIRLGKEIVMKAFFAKALCLAMVMISSGMFASGATYAQESIQSSLIAFVSDLDGDYEIYTVQLDGENRRQITFNDDFDSEPVWSPDGREIAFASTREGHLDIYLMSSDGSNQRAITSEINGRSPAWSTQGDRIAFSVPNPYDIYVIKRDGTNLINITATVDAPAFSPFWSRDDSTVYFAAVLGQFDRDINAFNLCWIDLADSDLQPTCADQVFPRQMSISPSGDQLLQVVQFTGGPGGSVIAVSDLRGENLTLLTSLETEYADYPAWSPDGAFIVALYEGIEQPFALSVLTSDGDFVYAVLEATDEEQIESPSWQPILIHQQPLGNDS
jgi:Tol biopolymer transport system component